MSAINDIRVTSYLLCRVRSKIRVRGNRRQELSFKDGPTITKRFRLRGYQTAVSDPVNFVKIGKIINFPLNVPEKFYFSKTEIYGKEHLSMNMFTTLEVDMLKMIVI